MNKLNFTVSRIRCLLPAQLQEKGQGKAEQGVNSNHSPKLVALPAAACKWGYRCLSRQTVVSEEKKGVSGGS